MAQPKHFLDLSEVTTDDLSEILETSRQLKDARAGQPKGVRDASTPLADRILIMIFEKPSTRTRVSFDVAMRQAGGDVLMLSAADLQLGRGETIADTAQVLSRYGDAIMIRSTSHNSLLELAEHATIPVINGLTDLLHPCQAMADLQTMAEKVEPKAAVLAWVGDGNNVANSLLLLCAVLGIELRLATPESHRPAVRIRRWAEELAPASGARVIDPGGLLRRYLTPLGMHRVIRRVIGGNRQERARAHMQRDRQALNTVRGQAVEQLIGKVQASRWRRNGTRFRCVDRLIVFKVICIRRAPACNIGRQGRDARGAERLFKRTSARVKFQNDLRSLAACDARA